MHGGCGEQLRGSGGVAFAGNACHGYTDEHEWFAIFCKKIIGGISNTDEKRMTVRYPEFALKIRKDFSLCVLNF